jgi:hypothetical protein
MLTDDKRKNELFTLIHSLESFEKAYYKKMAKRYAENNRALHLQLFELIEKSGENDEKYYVKKMGIKSRAHFSGIKNHLWNDVLSAIVYHRRNDALAQLQFLILQAEILLSRNLISSAGKLLEIAWQATVKYEQYNIQTRLIHLKYKLLSFSDYKHYKTESANLLQLQQQVIQRQQCEQQLQMIRRELIGFKQFTYLRVSDSQLQRIKEIEGELTAIAIEPDCPLLQLLFLFNCCAAAHLSYNFEKCLEYTDRLSQLWEQHNYQIPHSVVLFLSCADYSFYNAFALKKVAIAERYLETYGNLSKAHLDKKDLEQWDIIAFHTQLKIYHKNARYDCVAELLASKAESVLEKALRVLPPVSGITIVSSICISWFVLEEYDKAESMLIDVNNMNHHVQREDVLYFTSIFYLLILFEKRNYMQLNQAISASYFRLYNRKKLQPFEKELMLFLKHLSNEYSNSGKIRIIQHFLEKLESYRNDPVKDLYFLYFNYFGWLESKIQRIRYTEYMRRQVQGISTTDNNNGVIMER